MAQILTLSAEDTWLFGSHPRKMFCEIGDYKGNGPRWDRADDDDIRRGWLLALYSEDTFTVTDG